jgi:hypothetical protein
LAFSYDQRFCIAPSALYEIYASAHHKRVSLASKDLYLIHVQWLDVGPIHFNYRHHVVVDGELPIWLAGK